MQGWQADGATKNIQTQAISKLQGVNICLTIKTSNIGLPVVCKSRKTHIEGVHLTMLSHIFSVQVKSGACYITGQWVRVENKIKQT